MYRVEGDKVDVYSFGVVMWELWTSLEPHAGMMYATLLHRRMTDPEMRPLVPGTPEWEQGHQAPGPAEPCHGWGDLMQRCWAQNPDDRPCFAEVVSELKEMLETVKPTRKKSGGQSLDQGDT